MIRRPRIVRTPLFAATLVSAALSGAAHAADNTRYISIAGSNAGPCTLAQPCRTLQKAIQVAPAGGEIRILGSGFYGNNATINKSLTLTGNGNTVFLGAELIVSKPGTVVALRDITLNGRGTIQAGLRISAAATVHVERCTIHGFTAAGILLGGGSSVEANVTDSIVRDAGIGLLVAGGTARISNSAFIANSVGITIVSGAVETRQNNTVRGNTSAQIQGTLTPLSGL